MSKKGENIYKRKDNRWEARYIRERAPDGSAKYGYCYGKSYREAKEKLTRARAELLLNTGIKEKENVKRLAVCCDEWLRLNSIKIKEATLVKYFTVLERHIKPVLGECSAKELTSSAVEDFTHHLLRNEGLAAKTVRDILAVLRSVLKYCAREQGTDLSRIEVCYPRMVKKELRVLTPTEQRRLVNYLLTDTDSCKFATLLALLTGMRLGEVCALRAGDISLAERVVRVASTVQRIRNFGEGASSKTKLVLTDPKSRSSARIIPLSDFAVELCRKFVPSEPSAFVITGSPIFPFEPRSLQYKMAVYCEACELEGVHFHTLRHTFATRCAESGFEIKALSEILGHSSPQLTLERYVHPSLELKRSSMNRLVMV